jgi:hypothetical protein
MSDRSDPLDDRIDAVARQKSSGRPRSDLTQRIVFRIAEMETTPPNRSRLAWRASLAAASAFAVVIAVAIIIYMRQQPATVSNLAGPPRPPSWRGEVARTTPATPPSATSGRRHPRVRIEPAAPPPDEAIARLHVEPISVQPIAEMPIDVPQNPPPDALALTPLSISPLSPQGER